MRYVHTNLVARDWRFLARFYETVFDCVPLPPERDLDSPWLASATGVPGAALQGMHLRLPGSNATLEIFEYGDVVDRPGAMPNERGYGHLAFEVDDVEACLARVLKHGGGRLGEVVTRAIANVGQLCFVYARDPEGNVLELQRWSSREVPVDEGYARWSESYDAEQNPTRDADAMVVRAWLPDLDGLDVLELGCGTGKNTALLSAARSVVAIDVSEAMMEKARIKAPGARYVHHDLRQMPWPVGDASVDLAMTNLVLEHIEHLRPVLTELARVLRPGGRALIVELHPYRQIGGKQARFVDPATSELLRVAAHPHSISEMTSAARESGLTVERIGEHGDDAGPALPGEAPRLLSIELLRAPSPGS